MFKSLFDLTKDVVEIATAPVEIASDLTRAAIKKQMLFIDGEECARQTLEEIR